MVKIGEEAFFGSDAQQAALKKGRALFDVVKGDGRFSCHGRVVGLVSPQTGPMPLIASLATLQGATHYACVSDEDIEGVLSDATELGLSPTHYTRWEIEDHNLNVPRNVAENISLPPKITLVRASENTPAATIDSFAETSLACGVLPAWRSAHLGMSLPACTLLAVTESGAVAASAYAASYVCDNSQLAREECFWGMLATHPEWRGHGMSLALGGRLLSLMHRDYGFTRFYTGIVAENAASKAVCHKLGLRPAGNSIVTFADAAQVPGGRMTK